MAKSNIYFSLGFIILLLLIFSLYTNFLSKSPIDNFMIGEKVKLVDCDKDMFSLSPEKERIAYLWKHNLWVVSIYGEKQKLTDIEVVETGKSYTNRQSIPIYRIEQKILSFSWSPTDDKILCEVREWDIKEWDNMRGYGNFKDVIWIVDVVTKNKYIIEGISSLWSEPSWSPNGEMIAYIAEGDIWVAKREMGNVWREKKITNIPEKIISYSWSPDGKKIAFIISGNKHLSVLDITTKEIQKLTYEDESVYKFQWLPTGDKIIYQSSKKGANEVWEREVNGAGFKPFIENLHNLSWSPNGEKGAKVIFRVSRDGRYENRLVTIDIKKRKIISSIFISSQPVPGVPFQFDKALWFQDGRTILLSTQQLDGKKGLYLADIKKKKIRFFIEEEGIQNYALLPNESRILFTTSKGNSSEIWIATLEKSN